MKGPVSYTLQAFTDRYGEVRYYDKALVPQMTIKNGAIVWAQTGFN